MKVIEHNVSTGETTERDYTQKELDDIAVMTIETAKRRTEQNKTLDIKTKRDAAIEKILMSDTSVEAIAYQDVINSG
jgi:hypothetical protein